MKNLNVIFNFHKKVVNHPLFKYEVLIINDIHGLKTLNLRLFI